MGEPKRPPQEASPGFPHINVGTELTSPKAKWGNPSDSKVSLGFPHVKFERNLSPLKQNGGALATTKSRGLPHINVGTDLNRPKEKWGNPNDQSRLSCPIKEKWGNPGNRSHLSSPMEKDGANQIVKPLDKPQWIVAQWPLSTHTIPGYS